jgi:hypothetical protein
MTGWYWIINRKRYGKKRPWLNLSYRIWGSHSGGYEVFYFLGYIAEYWVESQPMLRRNTPPTSLELKNTPSKKPAWSRQHAQLCLLPPSCWFLAWRILQHWRRRRHVPPKHRLTFNGLHGITSQKTDLLNLNYSPSIFPEGLRKASDRLSQDGPCPSRF